ncbi:MAG TPA: hypothetical protein VI669_00195 [Vicinamibacteria bacterium]
MADSNVPDYMKKVMVWDQTTSRLGEEKEEFPHLETHRIQLEGMSEEYKTVSARKLELSDKMRQTFRKGETLLDFLRTGIRQHYGLDSEKLFAYDMVPTTRRARPVRKKAAKPADPAPAPESAK